MDFAVRKGGLMENLIEKALILISCALVVTSVIFVTLKLLEIIDWSWAIALAPLWAPIALAVVICCLYIVIMTIMDILEDR